jgi:hypothetical protein
VTLERVCDTKAERREKLKENREIFAAVLQALGPPLGAAVCTLSSASGQPPYGLVLFAFICVHLRPIPGLDFRVGREKRYLVADERR